MEVEDAGYCIDGNARLVVSDCHYVRSDLTMDLGRNPLVLAGVEGVVDEFFDVYQGPVMVSMANLRGKLCFAEEVQHTAVCERLAGHLGNRFGGRGLHNH